jgi:hypothetical protein
VIHAKGWVIAGARASDPEASHEAAHGNLGIRSNQALLLLQLFANHPDGLTAVEAGILLDLARPDRRVSDLLTLGYLACVLDEHDQPVLRKPFGVPSKAARPGRVLIITNAGRNQLDGDL